MNESLLPIATFYNEYLFLYRLISIHKSIMFLPSSMRKIIPRTSLSYNCFIHSGEANKLLFNFLQHTTKQKFMLSRNQAHTFFNSLVLFHVAYFSIHVLFVEKITNSFKRENVPFNWKYINFGWIEFFWVV